MYMHNTRGGLFNLPLFLDVEKNKHSIEYAMSWFPEVDSKLYSALVLLDPEHRVAANLWDLIHLKHNLVTTTFSRIYPNSFVLPSHLPSGSQQAERNMQFYGTIQSTLMQAYKINALVEWQDIFFLPILYITFKLWLLTVVFLFVFKK